MISCPFFNEGKRLANGKIDNYNYGLIWYDIMKNSFSKGMLERICPKDAN